MEGAEPLPRRSLSVLPKLTTALPLITKRAQHSNNNLTKTSPDEQAGAVFVTEIFWPQALLQHLRPQFLAALGREVGRRDIEEGLAAGLAFLFHPVDGSGAGDEHRGGELGVGVEL